MNDFKEVELINGRLAMLATMGFCVQVGLDQALRGVCVQVRLDQALRGCPPRGAGSLSPGRFAHI